MPARLPWFDIVSLTCAPLSRNPINAALTARAMANFISRRQFTIEWGHCDPAGIVFTSRFFEFFDWGTWTLFEAVLGVRPPDFATAFGVVGIPLVDASARFLAPAGFGDTVELASQISRFRRSSFDVAHRLFVSGALAVDGLETRVWAVRDAADPSLIKSQPIPREVTERFDFEVTERFDLQ
jgi:4-hydroxybenzoyl-CoA thioesterase